jgi:Xaa-Pro aminopeptidase
LAEPGYYADGRFGIRIESIVLVREAKTRNNFGDKGYIGFEHVTLVCFTLSTKREILANVSCQCPIHKNLVDQGLLKPHERDWLNAYHAETFDKVAPLLQNDTRVLEWLRRECSPL